MIRIFALCIFLLLVAAYVWSSAQAVTQNAATNKARLSAEELGRAKALFVGKCARCHGPNGRGQTVLGKMLEVPDFTNERWWKDHDNDEDLRKSITNGNGDMPAFGKKLSKPEISVLERYVRQFNKDEQ